MDLPRDTVSGNVIPPGASASEVRDDVPIRASENEFIVPADVVRFLGLEKLEGLVNKAKESLAQMQENGRIGGKPMPPKPPMSQEMPAAPMGDPLQPRGMAEGGVVAPTSPQPSVAPTGPVPQATMQAYEGPNGKVIYIPILNGQPITEVPPGYRAIGAARQNMGQGQQPTRPGASGGGTSMLNTPRQMQENRPRGPQDWTVDDFVNYGQQLQGGTNDAVMGVINTIFPITNILTGLAERNMQNVVPGMLDTMIETGVDPQGNPISEEQMQGLTNTRSAMADRIANESGTRFNPFESISNLVGRVLGGGEQTSQSNSVATPQDRQSSGMGSPSFSVSGQLTPNQDKEDKQVGAKSFAYGGLVTSKPKQGFLKK